VALQIGLDGQSGEVLATTIHHIVASYGSHPNFLKHDGKPVLFFTNLNRLPVSAARLRAMVDPGYNQVWIAEGLNFGVLNQFDGINVLKVMHAGLPTDYLKAPRWAANTRAYGDKLWVATVMPGWDDSRVRDTGNSLRNVSTPFSANRQDGGVFVASWAAALSSNPDWILINSFNEWIEGTQIEPSQSYGPRYLEILAALRPEFQ
jgi:hypothetical protein